MADANKSCAFRTSIGGQALIEGILMRGPEKQAIVVRDQNGELVEKVEELRLIKDRHPILGWPLIRGTVNFLSSMVNGVKALMYSADFYPEEEVSEPSKFEQWLDRTFSNKKLEGLIVGFSVLLGIGLSVFLFLVLPTFLTGGLRHFFPDFPDKSGRANPDRFRPAFCRLQQILDNLNPRLSSHFFCQIQCQFPHICDLQTTYSNDTILQVFTPSHTIYPRKIATEKWIVCDASPAPGYLSIFFCITI